MKDEFVSRVGIWGQRHYNWLKKNKPTAINTLRMKGTLEQYLTGIDRDAREMFDRMMKEFAEFEGITDQLKADDQMAWVGRMNNIRARVTHAVNCELIYA